MATTTTLLTREQTREVDRLAEEQLGMPGLILMENAGRSFASYVLADLEGRGVPASGAEVAVLAGGGNNGGDGYVIARHLHNAGVEVTVYFAKPPDELKGDAAVNAEIAKRMKLPLKSLREPAKLQQARTQWDTCHVLVDALLGTGFHGSLRNDMVAIVKAINASKSADAVRIFAVDVPSGLDCNTGRPGDGSPAVEADVTVTFVANKTGFANDAAVRYVGRVVVGDIGVPPSLIDRAMG